MRSIPLVAFLSIFFTGLALAGENQRVIDLFEEAGKLAYPPGGKTDQAKAVAFLDAFLAKEGEQLSLYSRILIARKAAGYLASDTLGKNMEPLEAQNRCRQIIASAGDKPSENQGQAPILFGTVFAV